MRLFISFIIVCSLFQSCSGQEKEPAARKNEKSLNFESKQKLALNGKESTIYNSAAAALNFRFAAQKATPGVVHIKAVFPVKTEREFPDFFRDFFGDDFLRQYPPPGNSTPQMQMGSASGVIVSNDGYIVTNNHVVDDAESIEVVLYDERSYKARVIGTDAATDLALIKIEENNLLFIEFGNSDSVEVGDMVLAVGNPFNLASTVTAGIISAKARNINLSTEKFAVESYLQTDAAVNRGNSGGALVDINGKLIGINAAIATPTGSYAGYSFAIPVDIVKKVIDDLLLHGKVLRGYLGLIVSDMNSEKAKKLGISNTTGVFVDSLQQNGAALQAGIHINDVIIKIDDQIVETPPRLREIIARHRPGDKLQLIVIRDGKEKTISVVLKPAQDTEIEPKPGNELLKVLGVELDNLSAKEKEQLQLSGGVKVRKINKGKISRYSNMQEGFIVTKINGKSINNINDFIRELQDKKGGVMLEGIYPGVPGIYYYAFGMN